MTKKTFAALAKKVGYATIATGAAILVDKVVESIKKTATSSNESTDEIDECEDAEEEITA